MRRTGVVVADRGCLLWTKRDGLSMAGGVRAMKTMMPPGRDDGRDGVSGEVSWRRRCWCWRV